MNIQIFEGFQTVMLEVSIALLPLIAFFAAFQIFLLKLPMQRVLQVGLGFILTFFGLSFFIQGVHVGFMPIGTMIGERLGSRDYKWVLIPIGFVLGFSATFAEPAVSIMTDEVDQETGGYISRKMMLYTLSMGVGISIALSMLRILTGWSLWYFIIPGYLLAFILVFFSTQTFIGIAFDSGGVATGPMTVTFLVAVSVGISSVIKGSNPLTDGFGMIALVALTPIIAVLILGIIFTKKGGKSK
ncbi:MAG: DUF1538 domain-containing protein [Planococcus donghaensis]